MQIAITVFIILCFSIFFKSELLSQIPLLDVNNLLKKEINVTRTSIVPLDGVSQGKKYHHIIYDSTSYVAVFDSISTLTDSTLKISLLIQDYRKVIYADSIFLAVDTAGTFHLQYIVDKNGAIEDLFVDASIAKLEGYRKTDKVLRFDDLDATGLNNNLVLKTYRSASDYKIVDEVKSKVFQELTWLHLFPSLEYRDDDSYKSTQPLYLDLKMDRVPSSLTWSREDKSISVHQEVDQVEIYKGLVSEYELKEIEATGPDGFFFRISSDASYEWNTKLNIPKSITAELRTSVKGKEWMRRDQYMIEFIPKK